MNCVHCDHTHTSDMHISDIDFLDSRFPVIKIRIELCEYCYHSLTTDRSVYNQHIDDHVSSDQVRQSIYKLENEVITEKKEG